VPASPPPDPQAQRLLCLDPVPTLLKRAQAELAADFDFGRPLRVARAPGRLDVMGGIADYTGSLVCEATLDRAAAVVLQERGDGQVQACSLNLLDEQQPFVLRMPLEALAGSDAATLQREFNESGRRWAGYILGCLFLLHEQGYVDLSRMPRGLNLALYSTVPLGGGVSSSAAIEVATMMALVDHWQLRAGQARFTRADALPLDPMRLAWLCQQVENRIVGAPCGIMDQVTSIAGEEGCLLKLLCQPHELQGSLHLPAGMRVLGINSHVKHSVGGGAYGKTRCAAFMGHAIILERMRHMGAAAGQTLTADPMRGYLANLDADDYKKHFRPYLPSRMNGQEFLSRYGRTIDSATSVEPQVEYHVRQATDHHVLEARRVQQFVRFLEEAAAAPSGTRQQGLPLDKAGHLMYASHLSYTHDALLGADECDLLVDLVRRNEKAGLYGAKITGGGSGGTVAVLAEISARADAAIASIMQEYQQQVGVQPEAFLSSSTGAWAVGTAAC